MSWNTASTKNKVRLTAAAMLVSTFCPSQASAHSSTFEYNQRSTGARVVDNRVSGDYQMAVGESWSTHNRGVFYSNADKLQVTLLGIDSIISDAKMALGLSVKDLSEVFQVSRQTLYNHSKNANANISPKQLERYEEIRSILAPLRKALKVAPGASSKRLSVEGITLFSLLIQDKLDVELIVEVAGKVSDELVRRSNRLSSASISESERLKNISKFSG
ncbi:MAG: hypothetical protein OEW58_02060 [Gammaproteobacteria bacterium]|nr:hypothetical protein [Gammaproteobacteria bacterium]